MQLNFLRVILSHVTDVGDGFLKSNFHFIFSIAEQSAAPDLCVLDTWNCSCVSKPWYCIDPKSTNSYPLRAFCLFVGKRRAQAGCDGTWLFLEEQYTLRSSCSHLMAGTYRDRRTHASKVRTKGTVGDSPRWRCLLKVDLSQGNNSLRLALISVGLRVSFSVLH